MQAVKYVVLSGWLMTILAGAVQAQEGIPWAHDIQQAMQAAKQQNKLVMVHFWSPDCVPCRKLDTYVFPNPQVVRAIAANYVPVKVNAQQRRDLVQRYQVRSWPTDVILTADGRELHRATSPQNVRQYISSIDRIVKNFRTGPQRPWGEVAQDSQSGFQQTQYNPAASQFQPPPTTPSYSGYEQAGYGGNGQYQGANPSGAVTNPYGASNTNTTVQAPTGNAAPVNSPYANPYAGGPYTGPVQNAGQPVAATNQYFQQQANQGATPSSYQPGNYQQPQSGPPRVATNPNSPPPAVANQHFVGNAAPQNQNPPPRNSAANQNAQSPSAGHSYQPSIPPGNPQLAMDGYCPVTMFDQTTWKRGDVRYGAIHRNRTYLFAGSAEQKRFLADPDKYSPALSGYDPVRFADSRQLINGDRRHGVFYRNQIFLFADEAGLERFSQSPQTYATTVHQAMRQDALNQTRR